MQVESSTFSVCFKFFGYFDVKVGNFLAIGKYSIIFFDNRVKINDLSAFLGKRIR